MAAEFEYRLLGQVGIWRGDEPLATLTTQQRTILAALLLEPGQDVSMDRFVPMLWTGEPPRSARNVIQVAVSRLRKALPREAQDTLRTTASGYRFTGDPQRVDLHRFRSLTERAARTSGEEASTLYREAIGLWHGPALAGTAPTELCGSLASSLDDERLAAMENGAAADLGLGRYQEVASSLALVAAEHPLRERLIGLLMTALARSQRRAEAIDLYHRVRGQLAEQLGVDPGEELQRVYLSVLTEDEDDETENDDGGPAEVQPPPPPAQLPAALHDFTGRAGFADELARLLRPSHEPVSGPLALAGNGGVGKTTLAVQVAHAAREHFPDGQLYVDLQGAGPAPADPEAVLGSFLRALGTPDDAIPEGVEERAGLYRSLLDGRRVLTLLDNARDAAQVRPLLPGTSGCATLITSRHRMVDLAGAHLVDLDVMSPEEALTLFTRIVGEERVHAESDAAMDVVAACGFLPLAIRIAASRLASRRTWTVSTLARKLSDERRRLDELQAGDQAVKATFELGYSQLTPTQARAFRLLGLAEGPDISLHAAAALLDQDPDTTEDILESLVDASLVESAAPHRYRLHDLVRLFARDCAERDEQPPQVRKAAKVRLLDFYLATAASVYALQRPGDRLVDHLEPTFQEGLSFEDADSAVDWLFTEADCLLSCVQQATDAETLRKSADVLLVSRDLSESGAFSRQYERACERVLEVAHKAEDAHAEGRVRVALAQAEHMADRLESSDEHGRRAIILGIAADDLVARAHAANNCGIIALYQNRHEDANAHLMNALEAFREDFDHPGEASALSCLSRVALQMGRTEKAVQLAQQSLEILRRMGSRLRLANGQYTLGIALAEDKQYTAAVHEFQSALRSFRSNRQRVWEGLTLFRLAETHLAMGEHTEAATLAEQALAQLRENSGPIWRASALTVLGRGLDAIGHSGRARACWEQALTLFEDEGSPEAAEVRNLLASSIV
jgi:DNA-binding SARP family transcriptional activator/tetratricopeptide (TPR) repeat protein